MSDAQPDPELPPEISSSACWLGSQLWERDDWRFDLSSDQTAQLVRNAQTLPENYQQAPLPPLMLDDKLMADLLRVQENLEHGSGACLIRGLGVEGGEEQCRRVFWLLTNVLGTPVSQSATGERIFSVRDARLPADHPGARGPNTRKGLSFHTDRCDVIAFFCLQQAKSGGMNQVASSMAIYNLIRQERPDLLSVLMDTYLYQRHNVDLGNASPYCEQPIFSFWEGHFACSFLRVLINRAYSAADTPEMTPSQLAALDFLEEVAGRDSVHTMLVQEPGDVLLLNNWTTLHRRDEFEDWPEEERRRHILRIWLAVPNSRPLHPAFAANYGDTRAGAIRGGMRPKS